MKRLFITKRGEKRLAANREYLEENFYPEYGRRLEDMFLQTIKLLPDDPELGREAFPELDRPELRKILCEHYDYWIYYRIKKSTIDILSIRHTLMNIDSPSKL